MSWGALRDASMLCQCHQAQYVMLQPTFSQSTVSSSSASRLIRKRCLQKPEETNCRLAGAQPLGTKLFVRNIVSRTQHICCRYSAGPLGPPSIKNVEASALHVFYASLNARTYPDRRHSVKEEEGEGCQLRVDGKVCKHPSWNPACALATHRQLKMLAIVLLCHRLLGLTGLYSSGNARKCCVPTCLCFCLDYSCFDF